MSKKYPIHEFKIDNIDTLYADVFKKWCEENCDGSWAIDHSNQSYNTVHTVTVGWIVIQFTEEKDAVAFKLRWM